MQTIRILLKLVFSKILQVIMNVLATLNRNINVDDMILCFFNIRPKLKCKHKYNLKNERHGVPPTTRPLLRYTRN